MCVRGRDSCLPHRTPGDTQGLTLRNRISVTIAPYGEDDENGRGCPRRVICRLPIPARWRRWRLGGRRLLPRGSALCIPPSRVGARARGGYVEAVCPAGSDTHREAPSDFSGRKMW